MIVSEIQLYELLKARMGEREAGAFVELLDKKVDQKFEEKLAWLANKQDLGDLRAELSRTIYLVSIGQLLAIVASVVAIVNLLRLKAKVKSIK